MAPYGFPYDMENHMVRIPVKLTMHAGGTVE